MRNEAKANLTIPKRTTYGPFPPNIQTRKASLKPTESPRARPEWQCDLDTTGILNARLAEVWQRLLLAAAHQNRDQLLAAESGLGNREAH